MNNQADSKGYRTAKKMYESGEQPFQTLFRKEYYDAMIEEHRSVFTQLGDPIIDEQEVELLGAIEKLRHHDEYFLIVNLLKMKIEWALGLGALGYSKDEASKWLLKSQHEIIHDKYYAFFMAMAFMMNQTLISQGVQLKPFGPRYIINVPLKKKNGTYVWVKQMSVPLSLDENGRMVRQLNSYTIVCGYDGVSLPILPKIYNANHTRARDVEKALFQAFAHKSSFTITETQRRVAETTLNLWKQKVEISTTTIKEKEQIAYPITHQDVANAMKGKYKKAHYTISEATVKKHFESLKQNIVGKFGIRFPNIVELSKFLNGLYLID